MQGSEMSLAILRPEGEYDTLLLQVGSWLLTLSDVPHI